MHNPKILDCTLRDGSYVIYFQFTSADTENIAYQLNKVGFSYIEVGHGVGLGASERGKNIAAASDVECMQVAAQAVKRGKWGVSLELQALTIFALQQTTVWTSYP